MCAVMNIRMSFLGSAEAVECYLQAAEIYTDMVWVLPVAGT